ncbi:TPM domain-containing protein [Oculatella sp. FACHB-28]|uniref:TPM domain-containing protein n=1 Tax=Cyanophyceae TaxID=3028117 RepID=UPI001686F5D2|nr:MULTISPECIES: TPM domain-containing protein [Cyanophyceae]MBD1997991.1 TPM domain-containing protein [Leptolyngbya sp. FACHB-541]MBD2056083.1 TPM domain-containing protein [Oculatella sp. FACHB-28]
MLKRIFGIAFLLLSLMLFTPTALAVSLDAVPNLQQFNGRVTDMAEMLSPDTEAELNQLVSKLNTEKGSEVVIITVTETPADITSKQFAASLFDRWDIDHSAQVPGVLLLVSRGDRRIEIRTGIRAIGMLPNSRVQRIIAQMQSSFRLERFDRGILVGVQALVQVLQGSRHTSFPAWLAFSLLFAVSGSVAVFGWLRGSPRSTFEGISEDNFRECINYYRSTGKDISTIYGGNGTDTYGGGDGGSCGGSDGGGAGGAW